MEFLKPSGYTGRAVFKGVEPGSNGLTFDKAGHLVLCQHGDRRVARLPRMAVSRRSRTSTWVNGSTAPTTSVYK